MIYKLKTDWLFEIKQFTSNLDLTISENLPLKKVTDFIEKNKDLSLTQRFSQITINHILFDLEHPFLYLNSIPLDLIKSAFDEVNASSLKNIEFSKKMNSTIKELQASQQLIKFGFNYNDKIPQKQIEDDFYLSDDTGKGYAFEVKSKQDNEYFIFALENCIKGKMYLHDYKKYISIIDANIQEKDFKKVLEFFDTKILVVNPINNLHFQNKKCITNKNETFCDSDDNDYFINTTQNDKLLYVKFFSSDYKLSLELNVTENYEPQQLSRTGVRVFFSDFLKKVHNNKNIVELEFETYLDGKLKDIKEQYLKSQKMQYRRNDKFGGFVYLHIPWNWKWKKKAISKSFEQLVSRLMNNLDIKFSIYVYLYKNEKQNQLIKILHKKYYYEKLHFKSKYKKVKRCFK
jgi:hypothetical protein